MERLSYVMRKRDGPILTHLLREANALRQILRCKMTFFILPTLLLYEEPLWLICRSSVLY